MIQGALVHATYLLHLGGTHKVRKPGEGRRKRMEAFWERVRSGEWTYYYVTVDFSFVTLNTTTMSKPQAYRKRSTMFCTLYVVNCEYYLHASTSLTVASNTAGRQPSNLLKKRLAASRTSSLHRPPRGGGSVGSVRTPRDRSKVRKAQGEVSQNSRFSSVGLRTLWMPLYPPSIINTQSLCKFSSFNTCFIEIDSGGLGTIIQPSRPYMAYITS